ncbi:hypothetical protein GGER_51770 [Serratia rubidaea]
MYLYEGLYELFNRTIFLFGIVVTVLALVLSFAMFKPNKSQLTTMKDWVSREKWTGTTIVVPLESWNQTDSKYGNDFFMIFILWQLSVKNLRDIVQRV